MASLTTTTIRVSNDTRERLKALSEREGRPAGEIVAKLVQAADDDHLLQDAESAFAAMTPEMLAAYRDESHEIQTGFGDPAPPW
jgi:predicted DNA-binding protein